MSVPCLHINKVCNRVKVLEDMIRGDCNYCKHSRGETFEGGVDCKLPYEECEEPWKSDVIHIKWELKGYKLPKIGD